MNPTQAPEVPDDANEDIEPASVPQRVPGAIEQVKDPEGEHRRHIERLRLDFAMWIAAGSLLLIVGLSVLEYFSPRGVSEPLANAADTLKLIATTALGFIFGRSLGRKDV